jgi:AraC-like DNA-binding protein
MVAPTTIQTARFIDETRAGRAKPPDTVDVKQLFRHAGILVTLWRCRVREAGATCMLDHRWHTIKFVHTGAFQAHLDDGTVHVDSTRALLATPGKPYLVTRQFGPDVSGSAIVIAPETASEITDDGDESVTRLVCEELTPRAILIQHLILRKIEECALPLAIAELGLTLAAEVFRAASPLPRQKRTPIPAGRRDGVAMAQAILAANYEKPIRLEEIARAVDLSPYYLCRTFKRTTGVHMHEYLNRLRLRAALEHVAEPRPGLAEIAHHYGFSSQSHFAAAFWKEFRISPSQVRRLATRSVAELQRTLEFAQFDYGRATHS